MRSILWLVAVVCIILFLITILTGNDFMGLGQLIYILLAIAIIVILYNIISGRRP